MLYTQHPIDYRGNSPRFEYLPVTDDAFDEAARERGYVKAPQLSNGPSRYLGRRYMETHPAESLRYLLDGVDMEALRSDRTGDYEHAVSALVDKVLAALGTEEA